MSLQNCVAHEKLEFTLPFTSSLISFYLSILSFVEEKFEIFVIKFTENICRTKKKTSDLLEIENENICSS